MAIQFKSLLQPLAILSALPFSFLGIAAGLHYTNNAFSFFVVVGFFAMMGISLNNTILLTDYANQVMKTGKNRAESMAEALKARFRPLATTSITSILALLPLAKADPFWESLAYTLVFGVMASTILVVLVYPQYYMISGFIGDGLKGLWRKVRSA